MRRDDVSNAKSSHVINLGAASNISCVVRFAVSSHLTVTVEVATSPTQLFVKDNKCYLLLLAYWPYLNIGAWSSNSQQPLLLNSTSFSFLPKPFFTIWALVRRKTTLPTAPVTLLQFTTL